jgi:uncharacterized protein involved in outer membrane biogenesis
VFSKRSLGIAAIVVFIVILAAFGFLATYDFNQLKPRISEIVRTQTGRELHMDGNVRLAIGLSPRLTIQSVTFQNASWGSRPELARVKKLEIQVDVLPLILGKVKVRRLSLLEPDILLEHNASGRSNLAFDLPRESEKEPLEPVPQEKNRSSEIFLAIREVYLENARLTVKDYRTKSTKTLEIAKLTLHSPGYAEPLKVKMEALFNGAPFRASGTLGAISNLFRHDLHWPIKMDINVLDTGVAAEGTIDDPLNMQAADLRLSASGADLSTLHSMAGRPLPSVPFGISGHLRYRVAGKLDVTGVQIRLAGSTVNGEVSAERLEGVPLIVAKLQSDSLDLRPLFPTDRKKLPGGPSHPGSSEKDKIFPDKPLDFRFFSRFAASVNVEIARLMMPGIAAEELSFRAGVKNGRLEISPFASKIGGGRLTGALDMVPQGKSIGVSTSIDAENVDLDWVAKSLQVKEGLKGLLHLTVRLKGRGNSVAGILAGLDGDIIATMGKGHFPLTNLNLLEADIGKSLLKMLNPFDKTNEGTDVNCLVMDFNIAKGQAKSDIILLDDPQKTLVGRADVDLGTEELDVWLDSKPKEGIGLEKTGKLSISLEELARSFKLGGTLAHPEVELDTLKTAKTVGTALLGPVGVAWLLVSGTSGEEDPCANAMKIAGKGAYKQATSDRKNKGFFDKLLNTIK